MDERLEHILDETSFSQLMTAQEKYDWIVGVMDSYGYEYEIQYVGIGSYVLIFKYPDTTCTDIYGNVEPITDLYIKLYLGERRDEYKYPYFRRMSGTLRQINKNYIHSHLNGYINQWTRTMCFGNSVDIIRTNFDDALILLLTSLDLFLKTESSNNVPYIRITNLNTNLRNQLNEYSYGYSTLARYFEYVENVVLVKIPDGYKLDVIFKNGLDDKLMEDGITSYCMNGYWFSSTNSASFYETYNISKQTLKFKDQNVEYKIIDSTDISVKLPCGQFKKNIVKAINDKFNGRESITHWITSFGTSRTQDSITS